MTSARASAALLRGPAATIWRSGRPETLRSEMLWRECSYTLTCLDSIPQLTSFCAGERGVAQRTYRHHLAEREIRVIALGDAMAGMFVLINLLGFFPEIEWLLCGRTQRCSEDLRRPFGEAGGRVIALGDVMAGGFVLINLPRFSPDIEWLLCGRAQRCSEDLRRPFGEAGGPRHCARRCYGGNVRTH